MEDQRVQTFWEVSQTFVAVFGYQYGVAVPDTTDALKVDSWLDADHHVFGQPVFTSLCEPWRLVGAKSYPVASAVQPLVFAEDPSLLRKALTVASSSLQDSPGLIISNANRRASDIAANAVWTSLDTGAVK